MIESSVLIRVILSILKTLERWYNGSGLHRVLASIGRGIKIAFSGSAIAYIFRHFEGALRTSWAFSCLRWLFRLLNTLFEWVRVRVKEAVADSTFFALTGQFRRAPTALRTTGMASVGFGLSILIFAMLKRDKTGFLGLVFVLFGFLAMYLSVHLDDKLHTSGVVRAVKRAAKVFVHDEEAELWNEK
ncbi:MAG: hypothetical protein SPI65_05570 [Peptoniphilus sp.]|nr:hypothetical protein [Peptoniphilus sp.]MDD7362573.1 hypothetical protein [Bacillota bacterium]MDY6045028.1 hypothetical protein [Peptoniphilus sp.]